MDSKLRKAYAFHKEHGGYIVGRRAEIALMAARDEAWLDAMEDEGRASFKWEYDDEPYDPGDMCTEDEAYAKFDSNEWTGPFGAVLRIDGEVIASLWGIVFGPRGTDDPYARCIRAELASEARYEFEREQAERERAANMDIPTVH